MNKILRKGMIASDTSTGFRVVGPTMLERLKRDVRKTRVHFGLGFINHDSCLSLV